MRFTPYSFLNLQSQNECNHVFGGFDENILFIRMELEGK